MRVMCCNLDKLDKWDEVTKTAIFQPGAVLATQPWHDAAADAMVPPNKWYDI